MPASRCTSPMAIAISFSRTASPRSAYGRVSKVCALAATAFVISRRDQKIQRIVAEDLPYVSLFYVDNVAVFSKRVKGMVLYPAGEYEFLRDIELVE